MRLTRLVTPLLVLGLLAGCGTDGDDGDDGAPGTRPQDAAASTTRTAPAQGQDPSTSPEEATTEEATTEEATKPPCDAGERAEWHDLMGTGGPDAFQLGEGGPGVVLLHQNDGRACAWVPFANQLAAQGYAVLVPVMESGTWPQPVIARGAEQLRGGGSDSIALVGASMGGTYAIAAAPDLAQPPDVVVAVSAPGYYRGASARDVIGDLTLPVLLVAAQEDAGFADEGQTMAAAAQDAELVILPGYAHGIRLLEQDPDAARAVLDALHEHVPVDAGAD